MVFVCPEMKVHHSHLCLKFKEAKNYVCSSTLKTLDVKLYVCNTCYNGPFIKSVKDPLNKSLSLGQLHPAVQIVIKEKHKIVPWT